MNEFEEIIGYESVKNELHQIIDMFKNKDVYDSLGAKPVKGVLLYGAPGMGKTKLAEGLIRECSVKTFYLKKNKDTKESLEEIGNTFLEASKEESAIIFIDDMDKFSEESDGKKDAQAFAALQSGIDLVRDKNILVLATANNFHKLPESLIRCGRFDRKIHLLSPNREDGFQIMKHYLSTKKVSLDVNYEDIGKMMRYTSCSDLETLINESAIYAAYKRHDSITTDDILEAYLNREYQECAETFQVYSGNRLRDAAVHEAGHAVMAEILEAESVGFLSISTKETATGGFMYLCRNMNIRSENVLVALAGKAACELFLSGRCASGCSEDLDRAAYLILDGLTSNRLSSLSVRLTDDNPDGKLQEFYAERMDAIVRAELDNYFYKAKEILMKNKEYVLKVADALVEKKNLMFSDLKEIRKSVEIIMPDHMWY